MELRQVLREDALKVWPSIEPLVRKVANDKIGMDVLDVLGKVLSGEYLLMLGVDDGTPVIFCTLLTYYDGRHKVCCVNLVGGSKLEAAMPLLDEICKRCKAQGYDFVEGIGRHGWLRVLASRGFTQKKITVRKAL